VPLRKKKKRNNNNKKNMLHSTAWLTHKTTMLSGKKTILYYMTPCLWLFKKAKKIEIRPMVAKCRAGLGGFSIKRYQGDEIIFDCSSGCMDLHMLKHRECDT
jgi:hypothetical protein